MVSLQDLRVDEVVRLTQDNMVGMMRFWSNLTDSFYSKDDKSYFCVQSPLAHPLFNNVTRTNILRDKQAVETIIEDYKNLGVPFLWRVWDHDYPKYIGEILLAKGAEQIPSSTLMAIDLESFKTISDPIDDLIIRPVRNVQHASDFTKCSSSVFGIPSILSSTITNLISKQHQQLEHYVGYLQSRPVTTASIYFENGVAGIYNVATLTEYQGKGIGTEIMTALLLKSKLDGCKTAILHATPAGLQLYEKLGFQKYGEMRQYLFS